MLKLVSPDRRNLMLDLACGPGLFTYRLARNCPGWVIAYDLSWPMLRRARRQLRRHGAENVLLIRGSAFQLPFREGVFDSILCSGALHLFDRPDLALAEVSRTLSVAGEFVCQTTLKPKRSIGVATFLDRIIRFGFFRSVKEVHQLLESVGLRIDWERNQRIIYLLRARKE